MTSSTKLQISLFCGLLWLSACSMERGDNFEPIELTATSVAATVAAGGSSSSSPLTGNASDPAGIQNIHNLLAQVSEERLFADVESLASLPSRHVNTPGILVAANRIEEGFEAAGGNVQVERDRFLLTFDGQDTVQRNVVARIPGLQPELGTILVGAHYDSRSLEIDHAFAPSPGANDNATGVAALLEIARLVADVPLERTVLLVAFSAEEVGLEGSRHYANNTMTVEDQLQAVLILDSIGNQGGQPGIGRARLFSAPPAGSLSRELAIFLKEQGEVYVPEYEITVEDAIDRPDRNSDHVSFTRAGFPAVRIIEAAEDLNRQHSSRDLAETIDPNYLRDITRWVLAATLELAGIAEGGAS